MFKTIACVLALCAATPALADSRVVRFDDLNLTSPAGIERLEWRIKSAARAVCGATDAAYASVSVKQATSKCVTEARARAMQQVARLDRGSARGG